MNGAIDSHPCAGCKWLVYDGVDTSHGYNVGLPICKLGFFCVPVARCDAYEKESDYAAFRHER